MSRESPTEERPKPISSVKPKTLNELVEALRKLPPVNEDFVRDLEEIRRNQPPMPDDPCSS